MAHKFTIKIGKDLHEYSNFEDIPDKIDHVISFLPEIPPEPHNVRVVMKQEMNA